MTHVFIWGEDTKTEKVCEDGGRDWSDASTRQRMPSTVNYEKPAGRHDFSLGASGKNQRF